MASLTNLMTVLMVLLVGEEAAVEVKRMRKLANKSSNTDGINSMISTLLNTLGSRTVNISANHANLTSVAEERSVPICCIKETTTLGVSSGDSTTLDGST